MNTRIKKTLALGFVLFLTNVFLAACGQNSAYIDRRLADRLDAYAIQPLEMPELASPEMIALGEMLFWDPELSGNRDTACVTCHRPEFGTGDGLSLPAGTGGTGLGPARILAEDREFVPRNAAPLYNLGYPEWEVMFWDGRVEGNAETGFESPAYDALPDGLHNALAVQAMFPVTSRDEMLGERGDLDIFGQKNELAWIKDIYPERIWEGVMMRLLAIPEYRRLFQAAYPGQALEEMGFEYAANALAAYEIATFTFVDSPWDRYLRGEQDALTEAAKRGAELFYDEANCVRCHSGDHFTDFDFHNLAVPHIGPGKGHESPLDFGRARETGELCDLYAFRTPPLRNVAITGPWMHNGAYLTLEETIRHHLDPLAALQRYDLATLPSELQYEVVTDPEALTAARDCEDVYSDVIELSVTEVADLLAFLEALTSPSALNTDHLIPPAVPSGLPVGGQ